MGSVIYHLLVYRHQCDLPERFGKIETDWSYVSQKTQRHVTDVMSETPVVSMTTSLISLCHLFVYILFFWSRPIEPWRPLPWGRRPLLEILDSPLNNEPITYETSCDVTVMRADQFSLTFVSWVVNVSYALWPNQYFNWVYFSKLVWPVF